MHQPNGAFTMHHGGEEDIRGAYCALSVASLTGILSDDIFKNTAEWIVRYKLKGKVMYSNFYFCNVLLVAKHMKEVLRDVREWRRMVVTHSADWLR